MTEPGTFTVVVEDEDVNRVRLDVNATVEEFSDQDIAEYIAATLGEDGRFDLDKAKAAIWSTKAGRYSALVNVSESGSSRNLGDLAKNALAMSKFWEGKVSTTETTEVVVETSRPRTRRIVRRE